MDDGGTYLIIESSGFTEMAHRFFASDEAYADFQAELARDPGRGSVVPGAGPLRKLRWSDPRRGKGKRGGLRIIYVHVPELRVLFLIDVYSKDESEDLSSDDKAELKSLVGVFVSELKARKERGEI